MKIQHRQGCAERLGMAAELTVIQRLDTCVLCAQKLPPKTCAWWDSAEQTVTCIACRPTGTTIPRQMRVSRRPPATVASGIGSDSMPHEYDRRVATLRRQPGVIFGEQVLGDIGAHLVEESAPTTSRAESAGDERVLAAFLDREVGHVSTVLHDRRVPATPNNIDHLVVSSTGIWVIGVGSHSGKVERRNVGGRLAPDPRLFVAQRNKTELVAGVTERATAVEQVLENVGFSSIPIRGCLCFTDADWRFRPKPFSIDGVWVGWPQALVETLRAAPVLERSALATLVQHLCVEFPASR